MRGKPLRAELVESWVEDALVLGFATGWATSPLQWKPRRGLRLPGRGLLRLNVISLVITVAVLLVKRVWGVKVYLGPSFARMVTGSVAFALGIAVVLFALAVPAAVVVLLFSVVGRSRLGRRGSRSFGTARWHPLRREWWNPGDAVAAAVVLRPDNPGAAEGLVPWTAGDATFVHFTWAQLSRHMLLVGATGSGKTTSVYHHLMLSSRVPWVYQDQKAELPLFDQFPERPVWGLDTRGYRSRSGVWNPMEEVQGPEDIEVMSALLFPDRGNMNDWIVRGARMLFEAMCKRWSFASLQEYVYLIEHTALDTIIAELPLGYTTALADARARAYYVGEILDVLRPWINTARIASVTFGRSTVTLDDFIRRGGYVLCNEDKHLRQPVTLFWGMLLHRLRNRPTGEASPLLLLLDELGDAGRIPNMAQALALYRSKGVAMVAGVQSLALMETVYGETEWKAVRDGFGTYVVLTANMTPQLQAEMTEQLGSYTMEHAQGGVSFSGPRPNVNVSASAPTRVASSLVPIDHWAYWSAARAAIVRGATGPTWWIPWPVDIVPSASGERVEGVTRNWRVSEARRVAELGSAVRATLTAGPVQSVLARDGSRDLQLF